ncbi:large ribosomal subunit protein mL54 [Cynoglossus semilaevis]|uniref:large ribosomal subunit protein mL54 n=1 Tax=Cynoglossus semilaevis TaxID=244447 RepID=UPI0004971D0A|nr:39S ribosomal protein L54, mitochondrial [Cynoglossus semilaevis]
MSSYRFWTTLALGKYTAVNNTSVFCSMNLLNRIQTRAYAKKVGIKGKGKGMVKEELKGPEVCKDPVRLTTYAVGVNIYKEGDDPKLKNPEEYPGWLYELHLGAAKKLTELEPESWQYWRRLRKENIWRSNRLSKGKQF